MLVLLCFFALEGGLGPVFRWVFERTFAQDGVAVFEALSFIECLLEVLVFMREVGRCLTGFMCPGCCLCKPACMKCDLGPFFLGWIFVDFGLSLAADRLRNIAEDVKAFTLEIVFDVTQRAQRGTSQGTAVVEPFQELVLHILYLNGGDPRMGFLVPFLGSIFDLFLDSALLVRDVFQRVS